MFELEQPTSAATESVQYERIKRVIEDIRSKSALPTETVKELAQIYMAYLLERGTTDAAKEYMTLDREVHGPASVATPKTGGVEPPPQNGSQATPVAPITPATPVVPVTDPAAAAAAQANAYASYYQQDPVNGGMGA